MNENAVCLIRRWSIGRAFSGKSDDNLGFRRDARVPGKSQRASTARFGRSRLILGGIVEVGEVAEIILGMTA